jgi:methionyl aminopeptidase
VIQLRGPREIELVRDASKIVAEALALVKDMVRPGITTGDLDRAVDTYIRDQGAYPAFKGYRGYPASICTSVNDEVVHGIPGERPLNDGDIVSVDVGTQKAGFFGDAARTFAVGQISDEAQHLLDVTYEALLEGIKRAVASNKIGDISAGIQGYVEKNGFSVVRDLVGHGIGRAMHEEPRIPNFGRAGTGPGIKPGMTLAIEPMVNVGGWRVKVLEDRWTVVTADGSLSAHFEHTVAVTREGPQVLSEL